MTGMHNRFYRLFSSSTVRFSLFILNLCLCHCIDLFLIDREKSEKQLKREAKKAEKTAKKAAHKAVEGKVSNVNEGDEDISGPDVSAGKYGNAPMNQSREIPSFRFIDVSVLSS